METELYKLGNEEREIRREKEEFGQNIELDPYFDLKKVYVGDHTFWSGEEVGILFFQGKQGPLVKGKNNNIIIFNDSKEVKISESSTTFLNKEEEQAFFKGQRVEEEIIVKAKNNPNPTIYYRIFISDDGRKINFFGTDNINSVPKSNEIFVFIEGDDDSITKNKEIYVKAGSDVVLGNLYLDELLNTYTSVGQDVIDEVVRKAYNGNELDISEALLHATAKENKTNLSFAFHLGKEGLNKLTDLLESFKVDPKEAAFLNEDGSSNVASYIDPLGNDLEKVKEDLDKWDEKMQLRIIQYSAPIANKIRSVIKLAKGIVTGAGYILSEIAKFSAKVLFHFASLVLGFINGVIDMIIGIIQLIGLIGAAYLSMPIILNGKDYYLTHPEKTAFLEELDNFIDNFSFDQVTEIFVSLWSSLKTFVEQIDFGGMGDYLKQKGGEAVDGVKNSDSHQWAYYIGYGLSFFIPFTWVTKLFAKLGPVGEAVNFLFARLEKILGDVFGFFAKKGKNAIDKITILIQAIREKTQGGASAFKKIIKEFFEGIGKWLDEVFPRWRKNYWLSDKFFRWGTDKTTIINASNLLKRSKDEFFDVLCHGSDKRVIIDGRKLKPEELAKKLIDEGWKTDEPIRLISCFTGAKPNGFASKLSKLLNVKVIAPNKPIRVDEFGEFVHYQNGKFLEFKPK